MPAGGSRNRAIVIEQNSTSSDLIFYKIHFLFFLHELCAVSWVPGKKRTNGSSGGEGLQLSSVEKYGD